MGTFSHRMNWPIMALDEHTPLPTSNDDFGLLDFVQTEPMIKLPPPDPLAFIEPFPLADLAPQLMTREQIESVVASAPKLHTNGADIPSKVVARISNHAVVKYGTDVSLSEARNMMTVQQQNAQSNDYVYIVMQYVPGRILAHTIEDLTKDSKRDLSSQLIQILNKIHTVNHTIPGPVGGGPALALPLFTTAGAGPFQSTADLIDWFNDCLDLCQSFRKASKQQRFDNDINDLVMCHLDLHLHNLMVDNADKLWLIDFDRAGFFPEYFEYVCLKCLVDFLVPSVAGAKLLQLVVNATETSEGRRMGTKFDAISFVLRR